MFLFCFLLGSIWELGCFCGVCVFFFFFKFTSWFCYGVTKFLCKQLCTGGAQCSANKQKRLEIKENISYPPFSPNAAKSKKLEVQIALIWYRSTVCSCSTRHYINSINKLITKTTRISCLLTDLLSQPFPCLSLVPSV